MKTCPTSTPSLAIGTVCLFLAGIAHAHLGGDESSVLRDAQAFGTMSVRHTANNLTRHVLQAGNSTVHEYVDTNGRVYAITFRGGPTPNLEVLLGDQHAAFMSHQWHTHRAAGVSTPTLKATLHGRPGSVAGLVWLPALVPVGVDVETLK